MKIFVLLAASVLTISDLPPAVRATVESQTKGAEIKAISKETEDGKVRFEVETVVNGKHRDIAVDTKGAVIEIEDEIAPADAPAAVRAAMTKKAVGGRIISVEAVTVGQGIVAYEAGYIDKMALRRPNSARYFCFTNRS